LLGNIIPESALLTAIVTAVKAGFADLETVVNQYEAAAAADKATLLGKISTVLSIVISDIQNFWNNLNIPNPAIGAIVEGILGIILSVLKGFLGALPAPAPTPATARVFAKVINTPARKMSKSQFEAEVNAILTQNGQPAVRFH